MPTKPSVPTVTDFANQINLTNPTTAQQNEMQSYLDAAQDMVEGLVGPLTVTQFTETVETRATSILLTHKPVQSIVSITPVLNTWPTFLPTDVNIDSDAGMIFRKDLGSLAGAYTIVYTAGMTAIPSAVWLAMLIIAQHLYGTQRGRDRRGSPTTDELAVPGAGFAIPNRAAELLAPFVTSTGIF